MENKKLCEQCLHGIKVAIFMADIQYPTRSTAQYMFCLAHMLRLYTEKVWSYPEEEYVETYRNACAIAQERCGASMQEMGQVMIDLMKYSAELL